MNDSKYHDQRANVNTLVPACKTREYENKVLRNSSSDKWGFCNDNCVGEKTDPGSKYNLAGGDYGEVWNENFYDLRTFGSGYCYTYNPPEQSRAHFQNNLFMLLGNRNTRESTELFIGFVVYLHEKGQFWPRVGLDVIGQSKAITLEKSLEMVGQFSVAVVESINKPNEPCTEDLQFSFTKCLLDYVQTKNNCKIDWRNVTTDPTFCPLDFNLNAYHNTLMNLQTASVANVTKTTGCLPKCKYTKYEFEMLTSENVNWKTDWISSFYIGPKSQSYISVKEYYQFGNEDLLADFGSYLGLFLGWSVLSISREIPVWLMKLGQYFTKSSSQDEDQRCEN